VQTHTVEITCRSPGRNLHKRECCIAVFRTRDVFDSNNLRLRWTCHRHYQAVLNSLCSKTKPRTTALHDIHLYDAAYTPLCSLFSVLFTTGRVVPWMPPDASQSASLVKVALPRDQGRGRGQTTVNECSCGE